MDIGGDAVGVLLEKWVSLGAEKSACRDDIHQLVAATESSDNGKMRWGCDEEETEMSKYLAESATRCQVDAHGHVVEDDEGNKRRCNLKTGRRK